MARVRVSWVVVENRPFPGVPCEIDWSLKTSHCTCLYESRGITVSVSVTESRRTQSPPLVSAGVAFFGPWLRPQEHLA